jgi:hypothetical protein
MQTLKAMVLSVLQVQSYRKRDQADGEESAELAGKYWRLRVSYLGPQTVYEMELREPLRSLASKKQTVGLNGLVEFEMSSEPQIDAYEPGEKILG